MEVVGFSDGGADSSLVGFVACELNEPVALGEANGVGGGERGGCGVDVDCLAKGVSVSAKTVDSFSVSDDKFDEFASSRRHQTGCGGASFLDNRIAGGKPSLDSSWRDDTVAVISEQVGDLRSTESCVSFSVGDCCRPIGDFDELISATPQKSPRGWLD